MPYVTLGLDIGTTGCKVVALGADGQLQGAAAATYPLLSDASGRAEQDPETLWTAVCAALTELAALLHTNNSRRKAEARLEVMGLALSGAMHSILPLGADAAPLAHALTWADSRAGASLPQFRAESHGQRGAKDGYSDASARLYEQTGCPLQTPYHPARLTWLRGAQPELVAQTHTFAALKDFIVTRLCNGSKPGSPRVTTDYGLASTTGLLDIHRLRWCEDALALSGLSADQLPLLARPTDQAGVLSREVAAATGLRAGLPIFFGGSDGGLANLGSGVARPGETILTLGTSGAVRQVADAPQLGSRQLTWCYLLDEGRYFAGGAINNGGLTLEWLRRTLYSEHPAEQGFAQLLAESGAAAASEIICLPYLTGERTPHWQAELRASFFGVAQPHTRADLARAGLEGVAFCLADVFELVQRSALPVQLTGGAARSRVLAQLITDTLGTPTELNHVADASALGAALLAQVALGEKTLPDAADQAAAGERTLLTPEPAAHARLQAKRRRAHALLEATQELLS